MAWTRDEVLAMDAAGRAACLRDGHPLAAEAIAGAEYRGVSLGLPALVERLTWKTFKKVFARGPDGAVRGWNVRLAQTGPDGAATPLRRRGRPVTFGHFRVVPAAGQRVPRPCAAGALLLHYGLGGNAALDPTAAMRDPLVALAPGRADLLLGWSYLDLGLARFGTPSYFLLERDCPLGDVVWPPGRAAW